MAPLRNVIAHSFVAFLAGGILLLTTVLGGNLPGLGYQELVHAPFGHNTGQSFSAALRRSDLSEHQEPLHATLFEFKENGCSWAPFAVLAAFDRLCPDIRRSHQGFSQSVDIAKLGQGHFDVWHGTLVFSSIDGSDPRTSGNQYFLWVPNRTAAIVISLAAAAALIWSLATLLREVRTLRKIIAPLLFIGILLAAPWIGSAALGVALGAVAIGVTFYMRVPKTSRVLRGLGFCLAGFIAVQLTVRTFSVVDDYSNLPLIKRAVEASATAKKPVLLFFGSSLTQIGIDEPTIENMLKASGVDAQVVTVATGGVNSIEEWYMLRTFLRHAKKLPALIMMENTLSWYMHPIYLTKLNPFNDRSVDSMDWQSTYWSLRWLLSASSERVSSRLYDAMMVMKHFAARELELGFVHKARSFDAVATAERWPHFTKQNRAAITDSERSHVIATAFTPHLVPYSPPARDRAWIAAFVTAQTDNAQAAGANIGFYSAPYISAAEIGYSLEFCRHMTDRPCLDLDDVGLFRKLDGPQFWLDGAAHLFGKGRIIFSQWLAKKLLEHKLVQ
jgi:hypothetical protein